MTIKQIKITANLILHTIEHILPMATVVEKSSDAEVGVQKFLVTFHNEKVLVDKAKLIQRVRTALVGFDVTSPIDGDAGMPATEFTLIVVNHSHKALAADLTKKQEKLDINEDGKIDGEDLKKVREGETAAPKLVPFSQWTMKSEPKYKKYNAFTDSCMELMVGKHKLQILGGDEGRSTIGVLDGKVFTGDNGRDSRSANKRVAEALQMEAHRLDGVTSAAKPDDKDKPFNYGEWKNSKVKPRKPANHKDAEDLYNAQKKKNAAAVVESRIKGAEEYQWCQFTGSSIEATNDKGRTLILKKGDKYGARKSSSGGGKFIRLVTEKDGMTKVFTCDQDLAAYLGKNSKACKAP